MAAYLSGGIQMKIVNFALIAGIFCLNGNCFAQCANFDALVTEAQTLASQFKLSNPGHPQCTNKPDESVLTSIIACFEDTNWQPVRTQAEADITLSSLYGAVTLCYRSGAGQLTPGKKSYFDLVAATQVDPTFEDAWLAFADTMAGMKVQGFFQKIAIQMGLGISIDDEVKVAIKGLEALPKDAAVTARLTKLQSLGELDLEEQVAQIQN